MIIEQHYLECLSQASYFIGDETTGRAVVIDPRRDISPYLASAEEHSMTIELVLETHFHADFLSGHLELADATGAAIGYGSKAETEFESRKFDDGERYSLGTVELEILHTPGHTPESISIVVYETADSQPHAVFTGDTLFIGDVGRPDLMASKGVTAEELASSLYNSLHSKLMALPDQTTVFPGHGAGSSCGKSLSSETSCDIGTQKANNYALAPMSEAEFIQVVTEGQNTAPAYFAFDAALNRELRPILDLSAQAAPMSMPEVVRAQRLGAIVLDTRDPMDFATGHLIGSVNVGIAGRYAEYAGGVIQPGAPIVIVADDGVEQEARLRLARIGFDNVAGYLENPIENFTAHPDDVQRSSRLNVSSMAEAIETIEGLQLVDVRQPGETAAGVIEGAIVMPLTTLNQKLSMLDASKPTIVYCAGGYRSSIAASRLRSVGFADVSDLIGGYGAWSAASEFSAA